MLTSLLNTYRNGSAERERRLANHLPMALVALDRLGASPERLAAFAAHYSPRLKPAMGLTHPMSWRDALGDPAAPELGLRACFADRIAAEGRDAVLRDTLPVLLEGVGASAFHALIRLGYVIDSGDWDDLPATLAYWTFAWLPLGVPGGTEVWTDDPAEALAALARLPAVREFRREGGLIFPRMQQAATLPGFAETVDGLKLGEESLPHLAGVAALLFAATRDFTALHGVTALRAMRVVLPWVEDRPAAFRHVWRALAAAYVTIGAPDLPPLSDPCAAAEGDRTGWDALATAARDSDDEHVIKAVDACMAEEAAYAGHPHVPLYRYAAARYVEEGEA